MYFSLWVQTVYYYYCNWRVLIPTSLSWRVSAAAMTVLSVNLNVHERSKYVMLGQFLIIWITPASFKCAHSLSTSSLRDRVLKFFKPSPVICLSFDKTSVFTFTKMVREDNDSIPLSKIRGTKYFPPRSYISIPCTPCTCRGDGPLIHTWICSNQTVCVIV